MLHLRVEGSVGSVEGSVGSVDGSVGSVEGSVGSVDGVVHYGDEVHVFTIVDRRHICHRNFYRITCHSLTIVCQMYQCVYTV